MSILARIVLHFQSDEIQLCSSIDVCLEDLTSNERLALAASRLNIVNSPVYSPDDIFCFRVEESIASYQVSLLVRRDYQLMNLVNKEMQALAEAGLISRWIKENTRKIVLRHEGILYIQAGAIKAVFLFFIFPIFSMAFSLFVIELLSGKENRIVTNVQLIKWGEILTDGKRHLFLGKN